jgi:hypothetical protein
MIGIVAGAFRPVTGYTGEIGRLLQEFCALGKSDWSSAEENSELT